MNIKVEFNNIYIMADYKKAFRNVIKKSFPDSVLLGCFFDVHYCKSILKKFKSLGILIKNFL